ncbi:ATP phosphoribosyltransferase regulatory subunit [Actinophytocola oryzae]|uniref:Histidyl-tRNA synthetase n=1 Tax=Actinophytocola oryzae TaxID=502181 RepID=A0A4R7VHR1_9PSEU|nr:HisS family protein [Actinophytocola oryzae]TDV48697.1 histidyl-tRNA synthetase [Actinophytocola oryzae]
MTIDQTQDTPRLDISMPGFPESLPGDVVFEQRIIRQIGEGFERGGFLPLDTAAVQRQEVLNAGGAQYLDGGIPEFAFTVVEPPESDTGTKFGLRYDLTVPVSRFIAERSADLSFPLHCYQINKVWRAEQMPTATHWREFYQCDVDVVGRDELSLMYDAEIACAVVSAFRDIGVDGFTVRASNRKVLAALLDSHGIRVHRARAIVQILDKGQRQEPAETAAQLQAAGFSATVATDLGRLTAATTLAQGRDLLVHRGADTAGLDELDTVLRAAADLGMPADHLVVDFSITRGHDYYTGTVFETFATGREHWGAIGAGGRYDDLLRHINGRDYPGVGMSVGLARLMGLLREDGLSREVEIRGNTTVVVPTADGCEDGVLRAVRELRGANIATRAVFDVVDSDGAVRLAADSAVAVLVEVGEGGVPTVRDLSAPEECHKSPANLVAAVESFFEAHRPA